MKNVRSLDTIADSIHKLERKNIFAIGDLLLEAKAQCEHGEWLDWLSREFDWSVDTAERYMRSAEMSAKFRNLRNLKLAATTLYELADHDEQEDLPAIIEELGKHATKTRLAPRDARRAIKLGIGRRRFGDHPDATLVKLAELDESALSGTRWYQKAMVALQERNPDTDESASLIADEAMADETEAKDNADQEAEFILDGPPPALPPPITPPDPQKFGADTEWEGREPFADAVTVLLMLRTKPVRRFVGKFSSSELREVSDFLLAIASEANSTSASSASEAAA